MDASNTAKRPTILASIGRRLADMFAKTIVIQTGNLTSVRGLADIYDNGRG
ncbi:hypothetical protein HX871_21855 [Pseudomonas reactans]|uniref:Uncharacterized protein n=1 Tax=Pseudomonas reactans TaxID=117680 RepID=A0ABX2QZ32_9PSED|nr:hypothetical protein [Pseudomonas reactans]NWA40329.1 hypothetical protein [Pseudomonas reactans]NWC85349.1 hypothetical protein [Pseudomonas reactans]NWD32202.1 hypothetical protein [Pseudomonas reactans]NWD97076.1 hypothetical protein [Pseudomonas reactans]NWF14430.1 hypothetical protein [Pseudomonas reactans]